MRGEGRKGERKRLIGDDTDTGQKLHSAWPHVPVPSSVHEKGYIQDQDQDRNGKSWRALSVVEVSCTCCNVDD